AMCYSSIPIAAFSILKRIERNATHGDQLRLLHPDLFQYPQTDRAQCDGTSSTERDTDQEPLSVSSNGSSAMRRSRRCNKRSYRPLSVSSNGSSAMRPPFQ